MGISAPANNEQGDGAAGPFSNCDFLKQLIAAQNSTSRQLAALSSQITEQTLLLKDVLDEMRQRDCKEPTSAPERMKRAHSLAIAVSKFFLARQCLNIYCLFTRYTQRRAT